MNTTVTSSNFRLATKGLIALAMTGVVLTLPGCGGGGSEGAPLNPSPSPSNPLPISVNPAAVTVYYNQPVSLLISGGVGPFRVFSSNPSILPVLQDVIGSTITISPNNVLEDTGVVLTITDATGGSTSATVQVKPSTVAVGNLEITPASATPGTGCGTAVCSGQTAIAILTVKSATGTPLAGRQVRFDALQGQYNFTLDDAGAQLSKSVTVTTDSTGRATVRLRADTNASTAFALIRATDLANGSRIDKSFAIAQFLDGAGTLSAIPSGGYSGKGFYKGECGGSTGDFVLYGGTAPYTIRTSLPGAITLISDAGQSGSQVTVSALGGRFTVKTQYFGSGCSGYKDTISITDATGRLVSVTYEEQQGTEALPTPAPTAAPNALSVNPATFSRDANAIVGGTCSGGTNYFIGGGVAPYRVISSDSRATVNGLISTTVSDRLVPLTFSLLPVGSTTLTIEDALGKIIVATFTCAAPKL